MSEDETKTLFEIPDTNVAILKGKIEKLNKRGLKLGCQPISFKEITKTIKHIVKRQQLEDGTFYTEDLYIPFTNIEVIGATPKLEGWEFIARIEDTDAGPVINTSPFARWEIPEQFRSVDTTRCDHCHVARTDRKAVFVLRHTDTGKWKCVGSTCLKDFMGTNKDPEKVAKFYEDLYASLRSWGEYHGGPREEIFVPRDEFLFRAAFFINKYGYISRKKLQQLENGDVEYRVSDLGYLETTAHSAYNTFYLYRYEKYAHVRWEYNYFRNYDGSLPERYGKNEPQRNMTDEEYTKAKELTDKVITYLNEFLQTPTDQLDDFGHNLKTILSSEFVNRKHVGYAAAIFPRYWYHVRELEESKTTKRADFVGQEGEKIEVDIAHTYTKDINTRYGTTRLHVFTDGTNYFKWFTQTSETFEANRIYHIRGTVKRHDLYNNKKSTILLRVKVLSSRETNVEQRFAHVEVT